VEGGEHQVEEKQGEVTDLLNEEDKEHR